MSDRAETGARAPSSVLIAALVSGSLFGFGLALSTMVRPEVVLSFLRLQDFGLALVMGGAVAVTLVAYKAAPRLLGRPLLGERFDFQVRPWNRDTFLGSAVFGVGWGLCGVCPGPAIAALGTGDVRLLWALLGIGLGALVQGMLARD